MTDEATAVTDQDKIRNDLIRIQHAANERSSAAWAKAIRDQQLELRGALSPSTPLVEPSGVGE